MSAHRVLIGKAAEQIASSSPDTIHRLMAEFGAYASDAEALASAPWLRLAAVKALQELAAQMLMMDESLYTVFRDGAGGMVTDADLEIVRALKPFFESPPCVVEAKLYEAMCICERHIDRPFRLERYVEAFRRGKYPRGAIRVAIARAEWLDPGNRAWLWWVGDRLEEDFEQCKLFDDRYGCYDAVFRVKELFDSPEFVAWAVQNDDRLFQVCYFDKLRELGAKGLDILVGLESSLVEGFMGEFCKEHLWRLHYQRGNKNEAAVALKEVIASGELRGEQIGRALANLEVVARAAEQPELANDAAFRRKVFEIQNMLPGAARPNSLDFQATFDTCWERGEWRLVLRLLAIARHDATKPVMHWNSVQKVWHKFLSTAVVPGEDRTHQLDAARTAAVAVLTAVEDKDFVKNPRLLMPVLEEFRLARRGVAEWAVGILTSGEVGIDAVAVTEVYLDALKDTGLTHSVRCDFTFAAALANRRCGGARSAQLSQHRGFFEREGCAREYFGRARELLR